MCSHPIIRYRTIMLDMFYVSMICEKCDEELNKSVTSALVRDVTKAKER